MPYSGGEGPKGIGGPKAQENPPALNGSLLDLKVLEIGHGESAEEYLVLLLPTTNDPTLHNQIKNRSEDILEWVTSAKFHGNSVEVFAERLVAEELREKLTDMEFKDPNFDLTQLEIKSIDKAKDSAIEDIADILAIKEFEIAQNEAVKPLDPKALKNWGDTKDIIIPTAHLSLHSEQTGNQRLEYASIRKGDAIGKEEAARQNLFPIGHYADGKLIPTEYHGRHFFARAGKTADVAQFLARQNMPEQARVAANNLDKTVKGQQARSGGPRETATVQYARFGNWEKFKNLFSKQETAKAKTVMESVLVTGVNLPGTVQLVQFRHEDPLSTETASAFSVDPQDETGSDFLTSKGCVLVGNHIDGGKTSLIYTKPEYLKDVQQFVTHPFIF